MALYRCTETVDAFELTTQLKIGDDGGTTASGKPGDFLIVWLDSTMDIWPRGEFLKKYGKVGEECLRCQVFQAEGD